MRCVLLLALALSPWLTTSVYAQEQVEGGARPWYEALQVGTWGEVHGNFGLGSSPDSVDLHRAAVNLRHPFNERWQLRSELVLANAFIEDGDGALTIEELQLDFKLVTLANLRAGRMILPLGIVNRHAEPTLFYSVERPLVETTLLPSRWFADGIGAWGNLSKHFGYEFYLTNGLNGAKLDPILGLAPAQQRQVSGFSEPQFLVRADFVPIDLANQKMRLGGAYLWGGLDNGDGGLNPGVDADIQTWSMDLEYRVHQFEYSGLLVVHQFSGVVTLPAGIGEQMIGWYAQGAWHFWPAAFKRGSLVRSDAVVFYRYEDVRTQVDLGSAILFGDDRSERQRHHFGVTFYPLPALALKADFEIRDHALIGGQDDQFNLGIAWNIN